MEDKTHEDHLDNPINNQSENPPDLNIPCNGTDNIHRVQQNENMEVHHHAHHEGKKNWKSYAWEFIMLFLAVFCGFLAEYFLEHRIEKEKGKQYVETMIEDIISDSIKINKAIKLCTIQKLGLDSLANNVLSIPYTDSSLKRIYYLHLWYTRNDNIMYFTKRTISQLKNSGGMRLITNKLSSNEITLYNENAEGIEVQGKYFADEEINKLKYYNFRIFDISHFMNLNSRNIDSFFSSTAKIGLLNDDEKLLKEYGYFIVDAKQVLENYIYMVNEFQKQIPKTIETLKKENDLE